MWRFLGKTDLSLLMTSLSSTVPQIDLSVIFGPRLKHVKFSKIVEFRKIISKTIKNNFRVQVEMLVQELVAAESLTQWNRQWLLLSLLMNLIMRMEVLFKLAPLQQCYSLTFLFNSTKLDAMNLNK